LTPALYALVTLVRNGRLDEAAAWCDWLLTEDWIARVPMRRVMIGMVRAVAALRGGDSRTALRGIREVLAAVPPPAWGVVAGLPLSVAVRAATDLGDVQSARSYLAVPVPPAMFDTPFVLPYLQAVGRYHLAMGHRQSAQTHLRSCTDLMTKRGVDTVTIEGHERAVIPTTTTPGSDGAGAGRTFSVGEVVPGKDRADSVVRLTAFLDGAGGARLTDAEERVAALAAAGNTNRQIAENLFITVSTVEQHLTKIYRKLNVRSRSALSTGLREFR
jgi:DNA-binding CsgD family transcriptional regulator